MRSDLLLRLEGCGERAGGLEDVEHGGACEGEGFGGDVGRRAGAGAGAGVC